MRVVICHKMRWILSMIKYLPDIYLLKKIGIFARSNNSNNNSCNPIVPCGVRSIDVESTELNTEKGLKIKHFRELEVFFRLSDFSL